MGVWARAASKWKTQAARLIAHRTLGDVCARAGRHSDALAHLGVRHVDMPATPRRVWTALREARR